MSEQMIHYLGRICLRFIGACMKLDEETDEICRINGSPYCNHNCMYLGEKNVSLFGNPCMKWEAILEITQQRFIDASFCRKEWMQPSSAIFVKILGLNTLYHQNFFLDKMIFFV